MKPEASGQRKLRILLVDDDVATRSLLGSFLNQQGHQVVSAENGAEGLDAFLSGAAFDLFIIDVTMPVMDGLTLCAELKRRLETWVPIMMISANAEENDQVKGLDIGADYYLAKPISFPLLKAELAASQRIAGLYSDLQEKTDALERYYNRNRADNDLARELLDRIFQGDGKQQVDAQYMVTPAGEFSGDMIVTLRTPSQRHYSLVADATGHGLPAALTLMPAAETFYRLARDGYSLGAIARELNARLRTSLPRGRFVAATLIMVEPYSRRLEIWNGGNPPAWLFDDHRRELIRRFPSCHPALGVLPDEDFDPGLAACVYDPNHALLACTDGIVETESPTGEMFGVTGFEAVVTCPERDQDITLAVNQALDRFSGGTDARDDRTILVLPLIGFESGELTYQPEISIGNDAMTDGAMMQSRSREGWYFSVGVRGQTLKDAELSPMVNQMLTHIGLTGRSADRAHVCITELINNAIDHGVLGLDSALKNSPEGFDEYFSERRRRLEALRHGGVFIRANMDQLQGHYLLTMSISDTGSGFESEHYHKAASDSQPSGRGLRLVGELADSFSYSDGGATAEFQIILDARPGKGWPESTRPPGSGPVTHFETE
ncbi:MAG: SpoIIE family protein phosphatase [Marinobacter sp.]|uniref:ATP-binding SpoIIE family protein phosphatase n=1 Tax=Marinobacter sp. TaxID=50741 RepID=UPI00299E131B|nr:SpoIIE family protein phosphatase [Marinobacter sp.]MDX1635396.1 SpoIIE family protein phosphatase [Marinobacter sp.]